MWVNISYMEGMGWYGYGMDLYQYVYRSYLKPWLVDSYHGLWLY